MSNEPLSEVMRIRLTSGQHRLLSEVAALSGLNLSDYVRRRLTAADTLAEELDALRQAVQHLSQISETHAAELETAFLVRATARPEHRPGLSVCPGRRILSMHFTMHKRCT